ncbi:MAG: helix-turn-helix domain-containing protein [Ruminococcaceae bacterium]|nr:helix-turn-helix domain-containing protein [Oscillospiraceae bacterium]
MKLKDIREKRRITQTELADYLGVKRNTISRYETGDREPNNETLVRIAEYFDVSVDYLLGKTDITAPPSANIDDILLHALFDGDKEVTEEMMDEVKNFAQYVKEREKKKKYG